MRQTARPEFLAAVRLLAEPSEKMKAISAAMASISEPGSELARSLSRIRDVSSTLDRLGQPIGLKAIRRINDVAKSIGALGAEHAALSRALKGYSGLDPAIRSAWATGIRIDTDRWRAIASIMKRYGESHDAMAAASRTLMGGWASSLTVRPTPLGFGRTFAEAAALVASARVVVDDRALWERASGLSSLVAGISSVAESGGQDSVPTVALVSALEKEAERAGEMVGGSAGGTTTLFSVQYIELVVAILAFVLAALSYANDLAQPDHGPAIMERLDRVAASLAESSGRAERDLREVDVAVSVRTANIRQGPTTRSTVVGQFAPGDKAVIVGRTEEGWVEIEFVEPLSGITVRGWVYGKLVHRMQRP